MPPHNRIASRRAEVSQGNCRATIEINSNPHKGKILLSNTMLTVWRRKNKTRKLETKHHQGMLNQKNISQWTEESQSGPERRTPRNKGHFRGKQIHVSCSGTTNWKDKKLKGTSLKVMEQSDQTDKGKDSHSITWNREKREQPHSSQHEQKRKSFNLIG